MARNNKVYRAKTRRQTDDLLNESSAPRSPHCRRKTGAPADRSPQARPATASIGRPCAHTGLCTRAHPPHPGQQVATARGYTQIRTNPPTLVEPFRSPHPPSAAMRTPNHHHDHNTTTMNTNLIKKSATTHPSRGDQLDHEKVGPESRSSFHGVPTPAAGRDPLVRSMRSPRLWTRCPGGMPESGGKAAVHNVVGNMGEPSMRLGSHAASFPRRRGCPGSRGKLRWRSPT